MGFLDDLKDKAEKEIKEKVEEGIDKATDLGEKAVDKAKDTADKTVDKAKDTF